MRSVEEMRAAAAEHRSPAWRWRLHAEPEKAQCGLADDRTGHAQRRLNDDSRDGCGYDVTEEHPRGGCPDRAGSLHILELARTENLPTHDARIAHPADDGQREQHAADTRPKHRYQRNREQQS